MSFIVVPRYSSLLCRSDPAPSPFPVTIIYHNVDWDVERLEMKLEFFTEEELQPQKEPHKNLVVTRHNKVWRAVKFKKYKDEFINVDGVFALQAMKYLIEKQTRELKESNASIT